MSDNKPEPPTPPEQIGKTLVEFFRNPCARHVPFTSFRNPSGEDPHAPTASRLIEPTKEEPDESWLEFRDKPADIKAYLDRYVIRQDEAKKVLATAVCDHYNHARILRELRKKDPRAADEV